MTYQQPDPYQSQDPYQQPQSPAPMPTPYSPGPYPPAYQPQGYVQPIIVTAPQVPASGAATASLVLGIVGITVGWCLLGIPCILAVVFGHLGLTETKGGARSGHGQAVAGLIMGYVAAIPAVLIFFFSVIGSMTP